MSLLPLSSLSCTYSLTLARSRQSFEAVVGFTPRQAYPQLAAVAAQFLTPWELEYFSSLQFARRQESYLLGRFTAKQALAELLKEPNLQSIGIRPGVFEQPMVVYWSAEASGISISHCEQLATAVTFPASHPMGIDLEAIDARRLETLRSQMSKFELGWADRAAGGAAQSCTLIWTAKEALSKVLKCGLMSPMEVLGLCDLEPVGTGRWEGHYQNFPQYKCLAWATACSVLAITLPKNSTMVCDPALADSLF